MNQATVIVRRSSINDIKIRGIEVLIDGVLVANLQYGQTIETNVEPGTHTITVTNRLNTKSLEFEAKDDQRIAFETEGIALSGLWMLMTMLGTVAYKVTLKRQG